MLFILLVQRNKTLSHRYPKSHQQSKMISARVNSKLCSPKQATQFGRALGPLHQIQLSALGSTVGLQAVPSAHQTPRPPSQRHFSTTRPAQLRDFFPAKETAYIRKTPPAWPHHGYTEQEMLSVVPEHRPPGNVGEWMAWKLVRLCRYVLYMCVEVDLEVINIIMSLV